MVAWGPRDRLLMYTDGLSEARDAQGEFCQVSSLDTQVRSGPVERAVDAVVGAVSGHVPRGRLEDDLALVVIEQLPGTTPARSTSGAATDVSSS